MGQYHLLVNLDKLEYVHPHQLGDGLKAWEQFASGPGGTASAAVFLMTSPLPRGGGDIDSAYAGRWHGDRVTWVGDYAEKNDFAPVREDDIEIHPDIIYSLCSSTKNDRAGLIRHYEEVLEDEKRKTYHDTARRFLKVAKAGFWFTDITSYVRGSMANQLGGWIEYEVKPNKLQYADGTERVFESVRRHERE